MAAVPVQAGSPHHKSAVIVPEAETLRVSPAIIERLHRSAGQLTTETLRQDLVAGQLNGIGRQVAQIDREWDQLRKVSAAALRRMEADPELSRLSRYVEFVQHQVAAVKKDVRDLALMQRRGAWALRNIGESLQRDVCGARMILAEHVFDGFGKMMRDMARDESKEIEFRAAGMDVQADRFVLQTLKDPLMHLLRNTLAHGIESPRERERAGKKAAGAVSLRLEAQGNKLVVTVEDDGRGVDVRNVIQAAVAKRILTEDAAAALPPDEQMRLIFHPGISTTRAVTELSGRGMGLSVVSEAVTRLQGTVQVRRGTQSGTVFVVTVPLAVSSSRLLLVKCHDQQFAIASHAVDRVVRVKTSAIAAIEGRPAISFQGKLLPLTTLAYLLRLGDAQVAAERETIPVAILKSGNRRVAVAVDALLSEMECVIKDLSPIAMKAGGLSGGVVMGDGSVVLVLDAAELVAAFRRLAHKLAVLKTSAPAPEKRAPTILVVDDSMTTRTLEKSILEAHGYRVIVAVDGLEALTQLRSEPIDLVVSDIEMPRLDGFGLVQEIKQDAQLQKIPVLLVTSLEKREDKERGLALGADGYIVKQKFDQMVLLDTVRQML